MFRPAIFRRIGVALAVLGVMVSVCRLPAEDDAARIDRWIAALEDTNPDVREAAVVALWKQGAKAKPAIPALKKALKDGDANVRAAATRALLEIDQTLVHQELVRRVGDTKLPVEERRKACRELARNSWDDETAATALEELLSDPDVKELAAAAVKYIRARRGVGPALVRTIPGGDRTVVFSPDGNTLATPGTVPTVRLWDTQTGKEVASFRGEIPVLLPGGKTLYYRSDDRTIRLWDGKIEKEVGRLQAELSSGGPMGFSPDGKHLVSAGKDETVRLWDVATGKEKATLVGKESVSWSPDGKTVVTAGKDKTIRLWDASTGKEKPSLKARFPVCFSPDGALLAGEAGEKTVKLWEVAGGKERATLNDVEMRSAAFSLDGSTLALACRDDTIKLWDVGAGKMRGTLKGHTADVWSLVFSSDGQTLVSEAGRYSHKVEITTWDVQLGRERASATIQLGGRETSVGLSPDGKTVASEREVPALKVVDVLTGKEVASLKGHTETIASVAFSPDGKTLASGGWPYEQREIKLWDVAAGKEKATLKGHPGIVDSVAFSPDGKTLAGANSQAVKLWDVANGKERAPLLAEKDWGRAEGPVAFSPDGKTLASRGDRDSVVLWDPATGKSLATLEGHKHSVRAVCFSPIGKVLASAGEGDNGEGEVILWDVTLRKARAILKSQTRRMYGVAFSPDGRILASAGGTEKGNKPERGEIKLWDARTGLELTTVRDPDDAVVHAVAFSPDGKVLASVNDEGKIRLWATEVLLSARKRPE
jgi:WD40 repeat protein